MGEVERTRRRAWVGGMRELGAIGLAALFAVTAAACASGHGGEVSDAGLHDAEYVWNTPVAIETIVPRTTLAAGERVNASCVLYDEDGEVTEPPGVTFRIDYEPMTLFEMDGDAVVAAYVGTATVRCAAPALGLLDETPVAIEIVPGAPYTVHTQLDSNGATAGTSTGVSCIVFDAFGNTVTDFSHTVSASPTGDGLTTTSDSITATRTGLYEVSCVVSGAPELESAFLLVNPDLPASLSVGLTPERDSYVIGDQVILTHQVRDQFGNRVDDAVIAYSSSPSVPMPSAGRFQFDSDGVRTLTATVTSPTLDEVPLFGSVQVVVNTKGPDIQCRRIDNQAVAEDAYMLNRAPGSTVTVPVHVADEFGVDTVTIAVNGGTPVTATPGATPGIYQATLPIRFGMNFFDVVAKDNSPDAKENSTTCTVLAANQWTAENAFMNGALGLRLDQHAVDDQAAPPPIRSLNDILRIVLGSPAIRTMVNEALVASNPINRGGCGFFACEPDVNYNAGSITWDPPENTLQLIPGGLRASVVLRNVRLTVRACGTFCCPGGTTITVRASTITASIDFGLELQGGVLRASVLGDPTVTVGSVNIDGSGFCGFFLNLIQSFVTGTVRNAVRDALRDFLRTDVGPVLDELVSGLDISTLGSSFLVPRLDGSGTIELGFGVQMSSLNITSARLLLGIATRFTPTVAGHNRPTLGVARRPGTVLLDPPGTNTTRPVGLSLYEGALNQILHGLWRGGFFNASLSLGEGSASIDARLPAVAVLQGTGQALLMLGGIRAEVTIPGIINQPLALTFGGEATASVGLVGDDLSFGAVTLQQLYVSFDASIDQNQRDALEGLLTTVLQGVLADAINDGLPAIPIPSFTLPADLADYGLPAGGELGITNPVLGTNGQHFVLTGGFGIR
jgi:hypothetical protein